MDDEEVTLEGQFFEFSRYMDNKRDGKTINLYRSDFWLRQSKVLDDRKLTMTDTGVAWWKYCKTELTYEEWYAFLTELCQDKEMCQETVDLALTNCGIPGTTPVVVPTYRSFFDNFQSKSKMKF